MFDEWLHRLRQFIGRWRAVGGERHTTKCQYHFRKNRLIDRETGDSEGGSVWWMRVTDCVDFRTFAIDKQVHRQLARSAALVECIAVEICYGEQILRHAAFAGHRWRGEDSPIIQPHADVAV